MTQTILFLCEEYIWMVLSSTVSIFGLFCLYLLSLHSLCFGLNIIIISAFIVCSFANWKMSVCSRGIYLKKIDLLILWNDIAGVSHV